MISEHDWKMQYTKFPTDFFFAVHLAYIRSGYKISLTVHDTHKNSDLWS
jgi:hypothetical protein